MSEKKSNASLTVLDISRGFSVLNVGDQTIYFKHPSNVHYLQSEEYYDLRYQAAVKKGIKPEAKLLETYIKRGVWSTKNEEKIKSLEWVVSKSEMALSKITDNVQREVVKNSISGQEQELKELKGKREKLVGQSAESWANQQRIIKMAEDHIFSDKNCESKFDFGDDFRFIVAIQSKMHELSSKHNLLAAVYEPAFYDVYSLQHRDPMAIFGTNFFSITIFQRYLLSYASVVFNKLRNVEMPDDVRADPVKVFEFNPDNKNAGKKVTHGVDDLKASIRQKGKLTPEDLIK